MRYKKSDLAFRRLCRKNILDARVKGTVHCMEEKYLLFFLIETPKKSFFRYRHINILSVRFVSSLHVRG